MATKTTNKVTREAYETALKAYVQNNNTYAILAAKCDERVSKITAEYEDRFNDLKKSMAENFDTIQLFCETNRPELFPDRKSLEAYGAKVGFREGKEKVVLIKGFKLKDVVAKLQKLAAWKAFIRQTPELDKNALLTVRPKGMDKYGLTIVQEENFYIEVDQTEINPN